jgi:hypothetical protein
MKYVLIVLGAATITLGAYIAGYEQSSAVWRQTTAAQRQEIGNKQRITSYNAGYRAGKLEATSELIECDGVDDPKVKAQNDKMAGIMEGLGELDKSPFPCGE